MSLPFDMSRCNGFSYEQPRFNRACPLREKCQRFTDPITSDAVAPQSDWLCETPEFERRIPVEV